jgi:hypothetical protein
VRKVKRVAGPSRMIANFLVPIDGFIAISPAEWASGRAYLRILTGARVFGE